MMVIPLQEIEEEQQHVDLVQRAAHNTGRGVVLE